MISELQSRRMEEQSATQLPDPAATIQDPEMAENDSSTLASDPDEVSPSTYDEAENEETGRETAANSSQNRCHICRKTVSDRYIYELGRHSALFAHFECLKCLVCQEQLDENEFCRVRFRKLACRRHYKQLQGLRPSCHNCDELIDIQAPFVSLRVQGLAFHVACFRCACCQNQLTRGDQFVVRDGFQVLCRNCLERVTEGESQTGKRPRTQISHVNQQILLSSYEANKKPSKAMRLQLARRTGLTQRVIQVWFQNKRAKEKKLAKEEEQRRNNCSHGLRCFCHNCNAMRAWHTYSGAIGFENAGPPNLPVHAEPEVGAPCVTFAAGPAPLPPSGAELHRLAAPNSPDFASPAALPSLLPASLSGHAEPPTGHFSYTVA